MPRSGSRVRVPFFAHFLKAGYYPAFFIAYGDGDELLGEHYRKIVGNFEIRHYKNKNYWDLLLEILFLAMALNFVILLHYDVASIWKRIPN